MIKIYSLLFFVTISCISVQAEPISFAKEFCDLHFTEAALSERKRAEESVRNNKKVNYFKQFALVSKLSFDLLFSQKSFIQRKKITPANISEKDFTEFEQQLLEKSNIEGKKKLAFVNFIEEYLSDAEESELKEIHNELDRMNLHFKQNDFQRKIDSAIFSSSSAVCLSKLSDQNGNFITLNRYLKFIKIKQPLLEKENRAIWFKGFLSIYKKMKPFLIKNGWSVVENKSVNEIHQIISDKNPTELFFYEHAGELEFLSNKQVYYNYFLNDHLGNVFPPSFFMNLPLQTKRVIFYSCHGEEMIKAYGLEKSTFQVEYYVPSKMYQEVSKGVIRTSSYKGLKTSFKDKYGLENFGARKNCSLSIKHKVEKQGMSIFMDEYMIGSLNPLKQEETFYFPCSFISKNKTVLSIYSTLSGDFLKTIGVEEITINGKETFSHSDIKEEFKNNESGETVHLQTYIELKK